MNFRKFPALLLGVAVLTVIATPIVAAVATTDSDKDRYYVCTQVDDNGYCTPDQDDTLPIGAKGWENELCDTPVITQETDDWELIMSPSVEKVEGRRVNPGAAEAPQSQIDSNCGGEITGFLPGGREGDVDLFEKIESFIVLIGKIAVFISVAALIYGGIMFATAAGEEAKIQKAKKTIIGAIIGLIVGILAWNIVGYVIDWVA